MNNSQMERELFNNMFEEFIKCFRPFKRAAMMLMWPTLKMSLTLLFYVFFRKLIHSFMFVSWWVFVSCVVSYFEVPVSRVVCFPALPVPVVVYPGPDDFLLCGRWPRPHCVPLCLVPHVSNHLHLPVYLNPVGLFPQCGFVRFSSCLTGFCKGIDLLLAFGSNLSLTTTSWQFVSLCLPNSPKTCI